MINWKFWQFNEKILSTVILVGLTLLLQSRPALGTETRPLEANERIVKLFEGRWSGPCYNIKPSDTLKKTQFATGTRIVRFDPQARNLEWTTSYIENASKNYRLVGLKSGDGVFAVDEGGGALIESYLADQTLYSLFSVQGVQLHSAERIEGDKLYFELTVFPEQSDTPTTPVNSARLQTVQRCEFSRQ